MEYKENTLSYEDYCQLRNSVGWENYSMEQTKCALHSSLYTVTAVENGKTIAMARLIGDGLYDIIVDVVVQPDFQRQKIGTHLLTMLIDYAKNHTPIGGRTSLQLIADPGKEPFYEAFGFKKIPHESCGGGMRKVIYNEE